MFSQACVSLFMGEGVSLQTETPLGQRLVLDRDPPGRKLPQPLDGDPPVRQRAGGTHPTGMHSCFYKSQAYCTGSQTCYHSGARGS